MSKMAAHDLNFGHKPSVSVLISTYKRGHLIRYVLESLRNQTSRDFEVLVILKPSGDTTQKIVEEYSRWLRITLILQSQGNLVDALNLGIRQAQGRIIACVDDDAIPQSDWVENVIVTYKDSSIGGAAGNVVPVKLGEHHQPLTIGSSEIIPERKPSIGLLDLGPWRQPIEGLENSLVYISKAGLVEYNAAISLDAELHPVESLLGMGTNMTFLAESVRNFQFPGEWFLGLSNEQYLGWYIWRQGYRLLFSPAIRVGHIHHGQTLSRNIKKGKKDILRWIEYNLLFYRLYRLESHLSILHRIAWIVFYAMTTTKKFCLNKDSSQMARLKSIFYSEIIGLKILLHERFGSYYSPRADLCNLLGLTSSE